MLVSRYVSRDKFTKAPTFGHYTIRVPFPDYDVDSKQRQDRLLHDLTWPLLEQVENALLADAHAFGSRGLNDYLQSVSFEVTAIATIYKLADGEPDFSKGSAKTFFTSEYETFDFMRSQLAGHEEFPEFDPSNPEDDGRTRNGGWLGLVGRHELSGEFDPSPKIRFEDEYLRQKAAGIEVVQQYKITDIFVRATTVPFDSFPITSDIIEYFMEGDEMRRAMIKARTQETRMRHAAERAEREETRRLAQERIEAEKRAKEAAEQAERERKMREEIEAKVRREFAAREAWTAIGRLRAAALAPKPVAAKPKPVAAKPKPKPKPKPKQRKGPKRKVTTRKAPRKIPRKVAKPKKFKRSNRKPTRKPKKRR